MERDGFKCQHCHSQHNLRGHHVRYRKNLTECTIKDVLTLCERCHKKEHKRLRKQRRDNRKPKTDWLVNLILDHSATIYFNVNVDSLFR